MIYKFNKVALKYVDAEGVIKLTPKPERDHDNPHLFNGYACMFLDLAGYNGVMALTPKSFVEDAELFPGLYRRFDTSVDIVSHDEYNGVMAIGTFFKYRKFAQDVVHYGECYNWQFNSLKPFKAVYLSDLVKQPVRTYRMIKAVKDNGIDEAEKEFEELTLLRYRRSLRDVMVYKVCAGQKPSLIELIYFCVATLVTARKAPESYANGSSQLQALLRFWILKRNGYKSALLDYTMKEFFRLQNAGENYLAERVEMFFKDKDHPFHDLIWEVNIQKVLGV